MRATLLTALWALTSACPGPTRCPDGDGVGAWRPMPVENAPAQRWGHAMAAIPDGFLVWGGRGEAGLLGDGARYQERTQGFVPMNLVGAPGAREHFAWALAGAKLLVFGGLADGELGDGFLYDVTQDRWSALPVGGPDARHGASAAAPTRLPGANGVRFYVAAGWSRGEERRDLWALDVPDNDAPKWTLLSDALPLRMPVALFIEPTTLAPLAFSGLGVDGTSARAAVFDRSSQAWIMDVPDGAPAPREGHVALHDGRWLIVEGGVKPGHEAGESPGDYVRDGAFLKLRLGDADAGVAPGFVWQRFQDAAGVTVPRAHHAAVTTREALLVLGGNDPGYCGGGARWDVETLGWQRLAASGAPGTTIEPGAAWVVPSVDADGGVVQGGLYVFGGQRPPALRGELPTAAHWVP